MGLQGVDKTKGYVESFDIIKENTIRICEARTFSTVSSFVDLENGHAANNEAARKQKERDIGEFT